MYFSRSGMNKRRRITNKTLSFGWKFNFVCYSKKKPNEQSCWVSSADIRQLNIYRYNIRKRMRVICDTNLCRHNGCEQVYGADDVVEKRYILIQNTTDTHRVSEWLSNQFKITSKKSKHVQNSCVARELTLAPYQTETRKGWLILSNHSHRIIIESGGKEGSGIKWNTKYKLTFR